MSHLWDFLAAHPWVDCGEADPVVLESDHVRGSNVASLSDMAQRQFSIAKLDAESAMCEVRCANGPKRKTAEEQGGTPALRCRGRSPRPRPAGPGRGACDTPDVEGAPRGLT